METIHKLLTCALAIGLMFVSVYATGLCHENKRLETEKAALQARWDKEQEWVGRYKTWRAEWIRKHAPATPIEPFYE